MKKGILGSNKKTTIDNQNLTENAIEKPKFSQEK